MRKKIDTEKVAACALSAVAGAAGMTVGAAAFLGIRFGEENAAGWLGIGCILCMFLWGILMSYSGKRKGKHV